MGREMDREPNAEPHLESQKGGRFDADDHGCTGRYGEIRSCVVGLMILEELSNNIGLELK